MRHPPTLAYLRLFGRLKGCIPSSSIPSVTSQRFAPLRCPCLFSTMAPSNSKSTATITRTISLDGKQYDVVKEGLAEIYNPKTATDRAKKEKGSKDSKSTSQSVFYNPIQQFNRDLSVLAIRVFAEDLNAIRKAKWVEKQPQDEDPNSKKRKRETSSQDGEGQTRKQARTEEQQTEGEYQSVVHSEAQSVVHSETTINVNDDNATNGVGSAASDARLDLVPEGEAQSTGPTTTAKASRGNQTGEPKGPKGIMGWSFRVLDALSATGLRALRYATEIPAVHSVIANDISPSAIAAMKLNIQQNNMSSRITPITGNAITHMYHMAAGNPASPDGGRGKYTVIDLDPYGTAAPFFDAAIQALSDGGLLCVTCTDAGVFASVGYPEKTFAQYGGLPWKGPQSHEAGIRLILQSIATTAARYGIAIEPLLSLSIDFYVRVFVRIKKSQQEVKFLAGKTMTVNNCDSGCGAWTTQYLARTTARQNKNKEEVYKFTAAQSPQSNPLCEHCGQKTHLVGPMWGGPIHNPYFIQHILDLLPSLDKTTYQTIPRIEGMLTTARDETLLPPSAEGTDQTPQSNSPYPFPRLSQYQPDHHPFFLMPSHVSKILHCQSPSLDQLRGALLALNYRVTRTHSKPGSIRTDAPWDVIWEIMREWVRRYSPIRIHALRKDSPGWFLMQKRRENIKVRDLEGELEEISKKGCEDVSALKTELEALLFRLDKLTVVGKGQSSDNGQDEAMDGEENGEVELEGKEEGGNLMERKRQRAKKLAGLTITFDEKLGRELGAKKIVRYQVNPRANWGPMNKARPE